LTILSVSQDSIAYALYYLIVLFFLTQDFNQSSVSANDPFQRGYGG